MTRPGFGTRHPDLASLLDTQQPAASHEIAWADVEGYELASRLVTLDEALNATSTDLLAPVFLGLLGCLAVPGPKWRNGRRDGLKNRWGESPVWVRVPPSAPISILK